MIFLIVVLFFYSSVGAEPVVLTQPLESMEQCVALAPKVKAAAESRSDVRVAKVACFAVDPEGNKV